MEAPATSEGIKRVPKVPRGRARLARVLVFGLVVLYLALLVPLPAPPIPAGGGGHAFVWARDNYWQKLEQDFLQARNHDHQALQNRLTALFAKATDNLRALSQVNCRPEDPLFGEIQTNLFLVAPLVGATPERLGEFAALQGRLRRVAKEQAAHWDLSSRPARDQLYQVVFGARMAVEEALLQAPANGPQLPALCDPEPSLTPAAEVLGVRVHSGDVLVSRGGAPTSALIARGNDYPGTFSHVALLHVDEQTGRPLVVEALIERGTAVHSLDEYLADKKLRIMVLRLRSDLPAVKADPLLPHKAATAALREARSRHIPYDFAMDYRDHQKQFCSEVVAGAYERLGVRLWMGMTYISSPTLTAWLGSMGVRHFETQEPADLEYDPQLRVVAEWRDPQTLWKAHVDDAVTDVMLEEAAPGRPLDYDLRWLPLARLAKLWSLTLNLVGKVGPVPEGRGPATALRVDRYTKEHSRLVGRTLALAESFAKEKGYRPPFWELHQLARQAKHELP